MPKVFLSAGHGGSDPGAVAYGLLEKDINLNTMLACNDVLVRHGITTVLSRTKDEDDPTWQECNEANASGAELAVSFHANAGGGDGFEGFYWDDAKDEGKKIVLLAEKYVKELGQNSRGAKPGNHLYFLNHTNMQAVLFESFFLDNDKDNDIGDTVEEQKAFGVAYAKAILEYYGIPYVEPVTSKPQPAAPAKKTVDELAKEVIQGKWGNGADRKKRLTAAGYNYNQVQARVDEILSGKPAAPAKKTVDELAKEVIQGKWGNGAARRIKLAAAGYDYAAVQNRVNELLR